MTGIVVAKVIQRVLAKRVAKYPSTFIQEQEKEKEKEKWLSLVEKNNEFLEGNISSIKVTIIELYMELCICFFINLEAINTYRLSASFKELSGKEKASLIMCGLSALIIAGLPFYLICKYKTVNKDPSHSDSKFFLGVNLNFNKKKNAVVYPIIFMLRRIIFASLAITYTDPDSSGPFLQSVILMYIQLMIGAYLIEYNPFGDRYNNRIEVTNEVFVLI